MEVKWEGFEKTIWSNDERDFIHCSCVFFSIIPGNLLASRSRVCAQNLEALFLNHLWFVRSWCSLFHRPVDDHQISTFWIFEPSLQSMIEMICSWIVLLKLWSLNTANQRPKPHKHRFSRTQSISKIPKFTPVPPFSLLWRSTGGQLLHFEPVMWVAPHSTLWFRTRRCPRREAASFQVAPGHLFSSNLRAVGTYLTYGHVWKFGQSPNPMVYPHFHSFSTIPLELWGTILRQMGSISGAGLLLHMISSVRLFLWMGRKEIR
jgi:hypothetical protein